VFLTELLLTVLVLVVLNVAVAGSDADGVKVAYGMFFFCMAAAVIAVSSALVAFVLTTVLLYRGGKGRK
jgi:hypothetical protein